MSPRAVDADEDPEIDTQPCRLRTAAVTALVVARETADPCYDPLERDTMGMRRQRLVSVYIPNTISLYLNTYFSCLFLHYHHFRQRFEPFCICCTHTSKRNDKPTMLHTLTIVGGWNSDTISLYLNTYFSFITTPSDKGLNRFAFVVRIRINETTNQQCLTV